MYDDFMYIIFLMKFNILNKYTALICCLGCHEYHFIPTKRGPYINCEMTPLLVSFLTLFSIF